jgi:glutathione S-transferase
MKLYSSPNSPFGSRITIATRAKGISIEGLPLPAGGLKSAEYLAVNPIAKIPVLLTEVGTVIPESMAILDYLEDRFPTPSLRPRDPDQRARMNVAIHVMDTYVMASVIRTFPQLNPETRDQRIVDMELARWNHGLDVLAHFMATPLPEAEAGLSLADCALSTALHLNTRIARMLGVKEDPMTRHPVLLDFYSRINAHPIVGPVLADLTASQAQMDARAAAGKGH